MKAAALISAAGLPAMAETLRCEVAPPCASAPCGESVAIEFTIDRTQFAPAISAGEPPRRRVTTVQMGGSSFPADVLVMGDLRGFWSEAFGGGNVLFVVQPDGAAHYVEEPSGTRMEGTCTG